VQIIELQIGQLKKLLELTERYCVVMQTIRSSPPVVVSR
jgi:hypothetical protein